MNASKANWAVHVPENASDDLINLAIKEINDLEEIGAMSPQDLKNRERLQTYKLKKTRPFLYAPVVNEQRTNVIGWLKVLILTALGAAFCVLFLALMLSGPNKW